MRHVAKDRWNRAKVAACRTFPTLVIKDRNAKTRVFAKACMKTVQLCTKSCSKVIVCRYLWCAISCSSLGANDGKSVTCTMGGPPKSRLV